MQSITQPLPQVTRIKSVINYGSGGLLIDIECHLSNSLPNIIIVGAATRTVDEARERLRGAFSSSGLVLPRKRISINLAPADVPKDSSSLDVPMAVAILQADGQLTTLADNQIYIGELGLDGTIRPVRGIIGKLLAGRAAGIDTFYIPASNIRQATLVPGIAVVAIESLRELAGYLTGMAEPTIQYTGDGQPDIAETTAPSAAYAMAAPATAPTVTLDDITGQAQAKRALEIAAAGGHNLLLYGPPGTGKSMLAKALTGLLPPLTHEQMLAVTQLHSLTNHSYEHLVTARPLRSPHHSASQVAIVGGGSTIRPGEVSLAHHGVLFFDELPEFARSTLEALRQPLEDRMVTIVRAKGNVTYPANFTFVATANPCPCGYYGTSGTQSCNCPARSLALYRQRLSGPLLDRIDICVNVEDIDHTHLLDAPPVSGNQTIAAQQRIASARQLQAQRLATSKLNSDMDNHDIRSVAAISSHAKRILDMSAPQLHLSARAYMRCLKVARTIADLESSPQVAASHVAEALRYRMPATAAA